MSDLPFGWIGLFVLRAWTPAVFCHFSFKFVLFLSFKPKIYEFSVKYC